MSTLLEQFGERTRHGVRRVLGDLGDMVRRSVCHESHHLELVGGNKLRYQRPDDLPHEGVQINSSPVLPPVNRRPMVREG